MIGADVTITGNGDPQYERVLVGMEEADMEDFFLRWLVATVEGMDDAIELSGGVAGDMKKFLDVVNHFFGATVTLLMKETLVRVAEPALVPAVR